MASFELERFLLYLRAERNFSPQTIRAYKSDISEFSKFLKLKYPGIGFNKVTRLIVRDFLSTLARFKRATFIRHIASLKTFFRYLLRENIIDEDPTYSLSFPKKEKRMLLRHLHGAKDGNYR